MKNFTFQTVANAVAIAVAAWLVGGIELTGDDTWDTVLTLVLVALLFGLVNWLVKPVVGLLSLPLFILTLGLFTLVVNALMLWLTSWLSDQAGLTFHVDGFWAAFWGALIVSVVSWAVNVVLPDGD
ncbi:phage holin family protein [Streptomyces thermolineatus]|uniref:Phage holin family protein n=1 Tax=Streptomyces thermolineatus TaxID=44033 RepID=A0ABP5Y7F5_9ACTN